MTRLDRVYRIATVVASTFLLSSCSLLRPQPPLRTWPPLIERMSEVRQEIQVPFKRIPSGRSGIDFVGVEVQSRERSLLLLVDTGTSMTLLRESVRLELRLEKTTQGESVEPFEESTRMTIYSTSSLFIGGEALESEAVAFFPDKRFDGLTHGDDRPIDGILGATLLARGEVEFDMVGGTLAVRPFDSSQVEGPSNTVPLLSIPDLNGFTVPLQTGEGRIVRFILDTGTNADLILAAESELGKRAIERGETGSSTCRTLRGENLVGSHPLPEQLIIAGHSFDAGLPVFVQPRPEPRFEGSLGIPVFWASSRVILNQVLGLAYFQPLMSGPIS